MFLYGGFVGRFNFGVLKNMDRETLDKINRLKQENNTIILVHNYQLPEIQDIADFLGDSLDLAKRATEADADNIIFCGVDFMVESAKILNPDKNVIIPDESASCPMAAMVKPDKLTNLKAKHPDAEVVAYINTTADVKALADICCTSSNGQKVVESCNSDKIIFVPDRNLGSYIQKSVPDKDMILWPGYCSTHESITKDEILSLKKCYPKAEVLVHPECKPEVVEIADYAFSTNGMVNHAKASDKNEFIIGTEKELCYRLKNENPDKEFYSIASAVCTNMKKITLEKVLKSLESLKPSVELSDEMMKKAYRPLKRMMNIGRGD